MTKVHTLTHTHTRDTGAFTGAAHLPSILHTRTKHYGLTLTTHTGTGWSGGGGGSGTRGRTDLDGAEQRPPGRPLLCLPERAVCRLCAQLESGQVQGSVAARGNAAVVAAAAAAAARAGGLIRTGRSDRLGGRRRSRRKLSIYVQKSPSRPRLLLEHVNVNLLFTRFAKRCSIVHHGYCCYCSTPANCC